MAAIGISRISRIDVSASALSHPVGHQRAVLQRRLFVGRTDLENGLIARERRIYDFTGLAVQVGALKAKPVT